MRADLLFFLAVLLFFFILWLGSGGPTHPISFAGPYITPVTNVGVTQVGYGGDGFHASQEEISAGVREDLSDIRSDLNSLIVFGIASPLKDKVRITGVRNAGTEPDREYVTIRNAGSEPVTITGWRVQSAATDRGATIGEGVLLPSQGGGDETSPITLAPGDQAFLITGDSPIDESFKENQCVGYFGSSDKWQPALERSCPTPRAEFDEYYVGNDLKDSSCYQLAQETAQCTVPRTTTRTSSACSASSARTRRSATSRWHSEREARQRSNVRYAVTFTRSPSFTGVDSSNDCARSCSPWSSSTDAATSASLPAIVSRHRLVLQSTSVGACFIFANRSRSCSSVCAFHDASTSWVANMSPIDPLPPAPLP